MEHRFVDTPDGTLAGAWWAADALRPSCTWTYDVPERLLRVTRGRRSKDHLLPIGLALSTDEERRDILPRLAIEVARNMQRPKKAS